jgi:hypothetical protein
VCAAGSIAPEAVGPQCVHTDQDNPIRDDRRLPSTACDEKRHNASGDDEMRVEAALR